ncbi:MULTISPECIES: NAD(P)-dependent alcohol dehydrogenase [Actinosynnema]|uniref:NAD(P)-dependent alcohol dehydrogenase n=1 Tax=Actinosynnema TaxID=40566 RepID=UPI0020A4F84A|nr:NAD(P)-dependent alcohol dehydrogenase [Actinosynnema pretiosum]MCP2093794.1 aryl-alcohol dehydrogenase [Actinosynnema pretiosum]
MIRRARAALVERPGGPFEVREVELDDPRPDEVLVRVLAAGVCHTDLLMRRTWPERLLPMVFGHEGAGVVEAVGAGVASVVVGDSVCLSYRSCGRCAECAAGWNPYCLHAGANARGVREDGSTALRRAGTPVYGGFFGQSSFATHAIAHESSVVKVPADLPPVVAAPLGCSVQTGAGRVFNVLNAAPGEVLVVCGAGGVGLSALLAANVRGCRTVVVEPVESRRALALSLGAAAAVPPGTPLADLTGGGAHHAVDTTGRADAIGEAVGALRRRGTLALVGLGGKVELDLGTLVHNGIRVRGVIEGDAVPGTLIPDLVALHRQGVLPIERLIGEYPFEQIERAAQDATTGRCVKPVLRFDQQVS